ncbi:MAG: toluene monooxygenase system protein [Solirubrobacteraceae bacterium]|jgi:toluene monooxygenase system protein D|nr:toluene monooxygenase system protein [Solirubrobacteraceae bacterium]MEA2277278.1 toluene monooxygenase system protein [Solirubrobacteraceae bacterium]MEA2359749.1 toluene monooxygenase system protein [Solirubrobacteraceae bacterium]MEA2394216.1 toluene monooxygenase system protein [Solirubrobacteraceae bacterium]
MEQREALVGPVLNDREMYEAVVEAAEDDNPGVELFVEDQEGYFRVHAPQRLRLTQASLENALGRSFRLGELEPYLSSFGGRLKQEGEDELIFYLERAPEVTR